MIIFAHKQGAPGESLPVSACSWRASGWSTAPLHTSAWPRPCCPSARRSGPSCTERYGTWGRGWRLLACMPPPRRASTCWCTPQLWGAKAGRDYWGATPSLQNLELQLVFCCGFWMSELLNMTSFQLFKHLRPSAAQSNGTFFVCICWINSINKGSQLCGREMAVSMIASIKTKAECAPPNVLCVSLWWS